MLVKINSEKQLESFLAKNKKVIVMYGAKWCDACKKMKKQVEFTAENYNSKIKIAFVDVDENKLALKFIPLFKGVSNGKVIGEVVGSDSYEFKNLVKKVITSK